MRVVLFALLMGMGCFCQVKEDLGVLIQSATFTEPTVARAGASSDVHQFGFYGFSTGGLNAQLFDVNMTTGASRVVDTTREGTVGQAIVSTHNRKLYFTAGDPCHFYEFDSDSGVLTKISDPGWGANYCGSTILDKGVQFAAEGSAGHLFFGTSLRGTVFQYDTNTSALTDYGVMSPPSTAMTDMTMDGADNKKFTSATHSFVAGDVGAVVNVTSGAGWTPGAYTVASVSAGAAVLNSSPSAAGNVNLGTGELVNTLCTTPNCYRYVYTLQADASYVYAGMRDASTNSYWLTILKLSDRSQLDCWKDSPGTLGIVTRRTSDNAIVYYYGATEKWYLMPSDGTCPVSFLTSTPTVYTYNYGRLSDAATGFTLLSKYGVQAGLAATSFGYDVDLSGMNADSGTSGVATLQYRTPAGSGAYLSRQGTLVMRDMPVKLVSQQGSSDNIMAVSGAYGPDVRMSISNNTILDSGSSGQSTYGLLWESSSDAWYLSGYSAMFYRYTPANAWDVGYGVGVVECAEASPTNPCSTNSDLLKYPYYSFKGSDGLIYTISRDERSGNVGGGIRWYNLATHATASYRDGPPSLACFNPSGAATIGAGATVAYAGHGVDDIAYACAETVGKIFLFDIATKAITSTLTPIALSDNPGTLTVLPNDHLMGVVNDYPTAADYTIYSIDPATDTVDWSITGVATVGSGTTGVPAVGPDGYVYLYIGNNLTRLHPATGALETAYADSTAHGGMNLVTGPFGSAMYLWGSTHLYRINLWRPASFSVKNSQSTATQIRLKYGRTTTLDATAQTQACAYNALCTVVIPGHVIGDMYYQWQFLTAADAIVGQSDVTKVTLN